MLQLEAECNQSTVSLYSLYLYPLFLLPIIGFEHSQLMMVGIKGVTSEVFSQRDARQTCSENLLRHSNSLMFTMTLARVGISWSHTLSMLARLGLGLPGILKLS